SITLPAETLAGDRHFTVQVLDRTGTGEVAVFDTVVEVPARPRTEIDLEPRMITSGKAAQFHLTVRNEGNTTDPVRLVAVDPEAPRTGCDLEPRRTTTARPAQSHRTVRNEGNTTDPVRLVAVDPEPRASFTSTPHTVAPAPGNGTASALGIRAKRPWFGDPV